MFNLPVFELLLQDNPSLFTTQGLSALLQDCTHLRYPERYKFTYPSLLDRRVYLSLASFGEDYKPDGIASAYYLQHSQHYHSGQEIC